MNSNKPSFLALSCVGFLVSAPGLAAETAKTVPTPVQDRTGDRDIVVTGQKEAPPAKVESRAPRHAADDHRRQRTDHPQAEPPDAARRAPSPFPGITFGAGEGGGYGDSISLRGYAANNDVTVDGVRDSAQYSRTDPFNLQQVEVYNGANSVFNGSGSVGGTINLVSKVPTPDTLTIARGSVRTDDYYRAALDSNVRVSDLAAARVNAAYHHNDVPGRDVEKYERGGITPSVTLGIETPTGLTLGYVHQDDRNTPIYGVPWFDNGVVDGFAPDFDRSAYHGIVNLDRQDITLDRATATFRHAFAGGFGVRNLARWQRVGQYSVTSAPQGIFCLASTGRQPVTATPTSTVGGACPAAVPASSYLPSGLRGLVRDQENQSSTTSSTSGTRRAPGAGSTTSSPSACRARWRTITSPPPC